VERSRLLFRLNTGGLVDLLEIDMRILFAVVVACALLIGGACALSSAQEGKKEAKPEKEAAYELSELDGWVTETEIITAESAPPQFSLKLTVPMPTPGYELKVDKISKPDKDGRIQVKLTGTPPQGMVAQVITDEEFTAGLGSIDKGRYVVEIWYRLAGEKDYEIRDTILLNAS
jgi:hypothetical protein